MAAEDAKSQAECEMEMTKAEAAAQRERADALEAELLLVRRELEEAREAQKEVAVEADPVAVIDEPAVPVLPDDYETLRQKAEQYDKMSAQIGAVMLKADANAEAIIRNAKAEAEKMLNGINAELAATRSKAKGSADALIGEISGKVRDINSVCCEDIMTDLDGIRGALTTMLSAVEEKYTAINQRLDTARGDMEAAAKTAIYQAAAPRVLKSTQDKAE